ncbi:MAG: transposase zinc-binding domain-containing protein, partial [Bacillota bacterium]|nr:transposase zinc-binding domain-containing protein [Bacillota bacterium]
MLYILHPRQAVITNVDKMINCGDPSFDGAMYACSKCGMLKYVPFRCKSRFCPTCGVKYCQERSNAMSFKLIQCTHRHCVFTIDEELRHFFLEDRSLLNCLFNAVRSVVLRMAKMFTFHYNRHQDNVFVEKTIPALDFISLLIQHIPELHYKMTRYYGLYARHRQKVKSLTLAIHKSKHKTICSFTMWRNNMLISFGYDPLCCPNCKHTMSLT